MIYLVPDATTTAAVESIRMKFAGVRTVDALPPHITLKKRFALRDGVTEDDLVKVIDDLGLQPTVAEISAVERFGDALTIVMKSATLSSKHVQLCRMLAGKGVSGNTRFEGENFKAHLNIVRDPLYKTSATVEDLGIKNVSVTGVCLCETDPVERKVMRTVVCRTIA